MDPSAEELRAAATAFGIPLGREVAARLTRLLQLVLAGNERINLTSIVSWEEGVIRHILDSLAPLKLGFEPPPGARLADLGSGGGFPGLALALACPETAVTLIESTRKKAEFLKETAAELSLSNTVVSAARAEELGEAGADSFDLVTARAVASLPVLVELAHPLLRLGGKLLAWKGPETAGEIEAAQSAMDRLGASPERVAGYELPAGHGRRNLVAVIKTAPTPPGFPRRPGMAAKKPL